jgi:peptidoglycan-associated lipoprotein
MLRHHRRTALLMSIAALMIAGCTKRPAVATGWSAPAPVTTDATREVRVGGPAAPVGSGPGGADATSGARSGSPQGQAGATQSAGRPAVKDFAAVPDLVDIHFDFDRYDIPPAAAAALESNARWLKSNRGLLLIEGHCDERGTAEYNLALGERRAAAALSYLVSRGIAPSRITLVSYGKERPQCTERSESCWRSNRRAHFRVQTQ